MGSSDNKQQMKRLVKSLKAQGFHVELASRSGHYDVWTPDRDRRVSIAQTPSDWRGVKNAQSRLRRQLGYVPVRK